MITILTIYILTYSSFVLIEESHPWSKCVPVEHYFHLSIMNEIRFEFFRKKN